MSKTYTDQVQKAQLLVAGLKKNLELVKPVVSASNRLNAWSGQPPKPQR